MLPGAADAPISSLQRASLPGVAPKPSLCSPALVCRQRRDLVAYNEALRQRRIQALVQLQVTNGDMEAVQDAGAASAPPSLRADSPHGFPHPVNPPLSPFPTPPASFSHPRSFPGMSAGGPGGGLGPAGSIAQLQGMSGNSPGGMAMHPASHGRLIGQPVGNGVTMWGSRSGWGSPWGAPGGVGGPGHTARGGPGGPM